MEFYGGLAITQVLTQFNKNKTEMGGGIYLSTNKSICKPKWVPSYDFKSQVKWREMQRNSTGTHDQF